MLLITIDPTIFMIFVVIILFFAKLPNLHIRYPAGGMFYGMSVNFPVVLTLPTKYISYGMKLLIVLRYLK